MRQPDKATAADARAKGAAARLPRHAAATERNRDPILAVLQQVLPTRGLLLEISSGTGEHAAYMTPRLSSDLLWQPSDVAPEAIVDIDGHARESGCARINPAVVLDVRWPSWPVDSADALLCCNMIHIAPWTAAAGLFVGGARILRQGAPLLLYGPFRRRGVHTAPSNAAFDQSLKARDASSGVRCLDTEVEPLAESAGFRLDRVFEMPANNFLVLFRRIGA
ncbi:MAG: DUF938 domain-containing protein [Alphaproteobacteria bacterium]|nr:DUF938 domain-containing protein [Alphaproteobacteria bacterium]